MSNKSFNTILKEEFEKNASIEESKEEFSIKITENSNKDEEILNESYKLCILDENGDINKIIIFCKKKSFHDENKSKRYLIETYEKWMI